MTFDLKEMATLIFSAVAAGGVGFMFRWIRSVDTRLTRIETHLRLGFGKEEKV